MEGEEITEIVWRREKSGSCRRVHTRLMMSTDFVARNLLIVERIAQFAVVVDFHFHDFCCVVVSLRRFSCFVCQFTELVHARMFNS